MVSFMYVAPSSPELWPVLSEMLSFEISTNLDHDVGIEHILREEDPEDIVQEESWQEHGGYLEAGQPYKGYKRNAEPHAHGIHE